MMDKQGLNRIDTLMRVLIGLVCVMALSVGMGSSSCHPMNQPPSMEDGSELESALRGFHKNLRWARYEEASQLVAESYRPSFMGRYEEYGEDLHITLLEIRDIEMNQGETPEDKTYALVEVEQEWYREPSMTVKKERYMERWESTRHGWRLVERMEREAWREKEKAKKALEKKTQEANAQNTASK